MGLPFPGQVLLGRFDEPQNVRLCNLLCLLFATKCTTVLVRVLVVPTDSSLHYVPPYDPRARLLAISSGMACLQNPQMDWQ